MNYLSAINVLNNVLQNLGNVHTNKEQILAEKCGCFFDMEFNFMNELTKDHQ